VCALTADRNAEPLQKLNLRTGSTL
jgi:hypothetical protein